MSISASDTRLYAVRETTFGTSPTVALRSSSSITASVTSGVITFANVTTASDFKQGQIVSVSGFTSSEADYNGIYECDADGTGTDLTVYAPAGKTALSAATNSGGDTITIGNHYRCRFAQESLGYDPVRSQDDEITGSRGVADTAEDGKQTNGDLNGSIRLPNFWPWLQGMGASAWTYAGSDAEILSSGTAFSVSSNVITLGAGSWSNVAVGDMVRIYGGTNDGATGLVSVVSGGDLTLTHCSLTDHASLSNADIVVADKLNEGRTVFSSTVEREYQGTTNQFPRFTGKTPGQMTFSVGSRQRPRYSLSFIGADEVMVSDATPTTPLSGSAGDPEEAPLIGGKPLRPQDVEVWIDASTGGCATSAEFSWSNNLSGQECIGSDALQGMTVRDLTFTGTVTRRYATATQYDKFRNLSDATLMLKLKDPEGGAVGVIYAERINYTGASRAAGGREQDVEIPLAFESILNSAGTHNLTVYWWGK